MRDLAGVRGISIDLKGLKGNVDGLKDIRIFGGMMGYQWKILLIPDPQMYS